jgi:hypothetical protein
MKMTGWGSSRERLLTCLPSPQAFPEFILTGDELLGTAV